MTYTIPTVTRQPISVGDRVSHARYGAGFNGTFAGWGKPEWACSEQHIASPGCRIAYVDTDEYGQQPAWESSVLLDGQPIYVARKS